MSTIRRVLLPIANQGWVGRISIPAAFVTKTMGWGCVTDIPAIWPKTTTATTTRHFATFSTKKNNTKKRGNNSTAKKNNAPTTKQQQPPRRGRGGRHFALRKQEEKQQLEERARRKQEKKRFAAMKTVVPSAPLRAVPPALLAPTGSPHVYISKPALTLSPMYEDEDEDDDDEDSLTPEEAMYQAQSLFRNYTILPRLYETHEFLHVSPADFQFELPTQGIPEVAVLGRSNVGKSSLTNALMRKNLCQTSKSPGRTQIPYYYGLFSKEQRSSSSTQKIQSPNDAIGYLVDLPGYGFGTAPKHVVEAWQSKTQDWLLDRQEHGVLRRLYLLLDARRMELSELDTAVIQWLEEAQIPFTLCLTKADRVSLPLAIRQVNDYCIRFATRQGDTTQSPMVHVTSATKHWGIHELLESIEAEFLMQEEEDDDDEDLYDDDESDDEQKTVGQLK